MAEALFEEIASSTPTLLSAKPLSAEALYFLSGMELDARGTDTLTDWSKRLETRVLSQNSVNVLRIFNLPIPAEVAAYYRIGSEWNTLNRARTDLDATDAFVREHYEKIRHHVHAAARWSLPTGVDVDDITQEVALKLLTRRDFGESTILNIDAYIRKVASAAVIDRWRAAQRRRTGQLVPLSDGIDVPDLSRDPFSDVVNKELGQQIMASISKLSPRERKAAEVYTKERDLTKVAEELGMQPTSLRILLHRIRLKLRQDLTR